jgi:hypothetical protein
MEQRNRNVTRILYLVFAVVGKILILFSIFDVIAIVAWKSGQGR